MLSIFMFSFCNTHDFQCFIWETFWLMVTRLDTECYGLFSYLLIVVDARLEDTDCYCIL